MITAWVHILRRQTGGRVEPTVKAAGFALVGITLALLVLPYRINWDNLKPRVDYHGTRCYITGSQPRNQPQEYLLYCPDAPVPKVRVVPANDPALKPTGVIESIFSAN